MFILKFIRLRTKISLGRVIHHLEIPFAFIIRVSKKLLFEIRLHLRSKHLAVIRVNLNIFIAHSLLVERGGRAIALFGLKLGELGFLDLGSNSGDLRLECFRACLLYTSDAADE